MLAKKERLNRVQFNTAFSSGKRLHVAYMQVIVSPSPSFHGSIVVPKKVYKRAVDRNKLRRQLYAVLYEYSKSCQLHKTVIVVVKPAIKGVSFKVFKPELLKALL